MYFDAHAHIASSPKKYRDVPAVIKRAKGAGVERIVDAGIDLATSEDVLKLHDQYPDIIIPTIGLHPELLIPGSDIYDERLGFNAGALNQQIETLRKLYLKNADKVGAIGECGLDYYWLANSGEQIPRQAHDTVANSENETIKKQLKLLFKKQIELANEFDLPLVVHSRGAEKECLLMTNNQLPMIKQTPMTNNQCPKIKSKRLRVLFHCFTGEKKVAEKIFKSGYYVSFNGILTYKNAENIREIFKFGWKNFKHLILAETDAPYLKPRVQSSATVPAGRQVEPTACEPADVVLVVEAMARIVGSDIKEVAQVTTKNAKEFYEISK